MDRFYMQPALLDNGSDNKNPGWSTKADVPAEFGAVIKKYSLISRIKAIFADNQYSKWNIKQVHKRIDIPGVEFDPVRAVLDKLTRDGVIEKCSQRSYTSAKKSHRKTRSPTSAQATMSTSLAPTPTIEKKLTKEDFIAPEKISKSTLKMLRGSTSYLDKVLGVFSDYNSKWTITEIAEKTDCHYLSSSGALQTLMQRLLVKRVAPGTYMRDRINIVDAILFELEKQVRNDIELLAYQCKLEVDEIRPALRYLEEKKLITVVDGEYLLPGRQPYGNKNSTFEKEPRSYPVAARRRSTPPPQPPRSMPPPRSQPLPPTPTQVQSKSDLPDQLKSLNLAFEEARKRSNFKTAVWAMLAQFSPEQRKQVLLELVVDIETNPNPWWILSLTKEGP